MRPLIAVAVAVAGAALLGLAAPASAQSMPGGAPGALPGGLSAGDALALFQTLTPQQKQLLATGALRGKDAISPADAFAWYQSMTPQQKQQARELAQQQLAANPGLKEQAKALYKAWRGQ